MYGFPLERGYQRAIEYSRSNTGGGGGGGESYPNAYWKRIGGHFARILDAVLVIVLGINWIKVN